MKFLKEFYHPYQKIKNDMKVVIIQNQEPSKVVKFILSIDINHKYSIKGNFGNFK